MRIQSPPSLLIAHAQIVLSRFGRVEGLIEVVKNPSLSLEIEGFHDGEQKECDAVMFLVSSARLLNLMGVCVSCCILPNPSLIYLLFLFFILFSLVCSRLSR